MKNCINCGAQLNDDQAFCTACGAQQPTGAPAYAVPNVQPIADPFDHTAEFDAQDVSDNKCYAILMYLSGLVGIIVAILACKDSPYVKFHMHQAIKISALSTIISFLSAALSWTFIVPTVGSIALCVICVVKIICLIQVCGNKSKEPAIIKSLNFLK